MSLTRMYCWLSSSISSCVIARNYLFLFLFIHLIHEPTRICIQWNNYNTARFKNILSIICSLFVVIYYIYITPFAIHLLMWSDGWKVQLYHTLDSTCFNVAVWCDVAAVTARLAKLVLGYVLDPVLEEGPEVVGVSDGIMRKSDGTPAGSPLWQLRCL